jgi:hypothetical protein
VSTPSKMIRWHRILGVVAVLHAISLCALPRLGLISSLSLFRLWAIVATLWIVWPFILFCHPGRSLRRVVLPILLSLPALWLIRADYSYMAPQVLFGTPEGVFLSIRDIRNYFAARQQGRAAAQRDLHSGVLAIEEYGMPKPRQFAEKLQQRYQIELRQIAGDTDVTAKVIGHAKGYNEVATAEIARKLGTQALQQTEEEAWKEYWHGNVPE